MRRLCEKAVELDIETVLIDLEDAVPGKEKSAARQGAVDMIALLPGRCHVRVNSLAVTKSFGSACGVEDLAAVMGPGIGGLIAPKIETADALRRMDEAITAAERSASVPAGTIELGVTIETALGVVNLVDISRVALARPMRLSFGMGDFTTDVGIEWSRDESECAVPRALVPIVSRAAGLARPRDSVFVNVADEQGLRESALRGKRLGYAGKSAIHPKQIAIIKEVYRPTQDEVSWARRVVDAAAEKTALGEGAFLLDGKMIDDPIVVRAREVIDQAMSEA
ncbi:HpcH/HpaI aldolase/citrate lyase family protein [Candidatus Burkholderia verschuerenii]|nr:CoA ester lyase [Candidatus Burkholderia verschuerenii]